METLDKRGVLNTECTGFIHLNVCALNGNISTSN